MDTPTKKSRKGLIVSISAAAVLAGLGLASAGSSTAPTSSTAQMQSAAVVNAVVPLATTSDVQATPLPQASVQEEAPQQGTNDLSNDSYYTNTAGHEVHTPAYDTGNDIPT